MQVDEPTLITQSQAGDHEAYAALVDRYKTAFYHHCFAMVRDEDVAADIAQETFIAAYYNLHKYNPTYRLATWLFKIATNKSLDYLRRASRQVAADDSLIAQIASQEPEPHTKAEYDELHTVVNNLRPKYRAAISLYYWQGLSYDEIALAMGSPVGSVKVWISRAKAAIKKELI